ncbi:MAG: hypothetical protein ABIC82_04095 [bacterium]
MTKKTILISTIFAVVVMFGFTSVVSAAGDEVILSADTSTPIYLQGTTTPSDLVANSGGQVTAMAVDTDKVTLSLGADSDITFSSQTGFVISASCASGATFTAGSPSSLRVDYNVSCTTVEVTVGPGTLTEPNVAASPLTAGTASAYTVTFKTVNPLVAGNKIQLDFGSEFTVATNLAESNVTTLTDDTVDISSGITLVTDATTRQIKITLNSTVAAQSVINIVLNSTLITNPATATATVAQSGIDIYTTTSAGTVIDSLLNQTAYDRVVELAVGWNVFAPSQELENSAKATVMAPISSSYSAIYTLAWSSTSSTMTWQTPTTIDPLYGYAIYNSSSSIIKLPLDFAKETPSNGLEQRTLSNVGWYLIGYVGTSDSKVAQTAGNCLDGLKGTGTGGNDAFSSIVDLTGKLAIGAAQTSHAIISVTQSEAAGANSGVGVMQFTRDYGYAVYVNSATNGGLSGNRGL